MAFLFQRIENGWRKYWFSPVSSVGFASFRIAFGFVLLIYHVPRLWYIRELYTAEGYLAPMDLFRALSLPIPNFPAAVVLNILLVLAILSLIAGYRTRFSAAIVFFLHSYFSLLEYFSTVGLGTIMMIYLLLLFFSPAGSFLSADFAKRRFREIREGRTKLKEDVLPPSVAVTMQRLMLWQLAAIYFFNALAKLKFGGEGWLDGSDLWFIFMNVGETSYSFMPSIVERISWLLPNIGIVNIIGLLLLGTVILIPRLRIYALAFGIIYHLVTMFTIAMAVTFSLLMFSLYVMAIEPKTWERWWGRFQKKLSKSHLQLFYDGGCNFCMRSVAVLKSLDFLNKIGVRDITAGAGPESKNGLLPQEELLREIHAVTPSGKVLSGFFALRRAAQYLPHCWPLIPLLWLPGMGIAGSTVYRFIARNRYTLCRGCEGNKL